MKNLEIRGVDYGRMDSGFWLVGFSAHYLKLGVLRFPSIFPRLFESRFCFHTLPIFAIL